MKKNLLWLFMGLLSVSLLNTSCEKDEDPIEEEKQKKSNITLSFYEDGSSHTLTIDAAYNTDVNTNKSGAMAWGWINSGLWMEAIDYKAENDINQFYLNIEGIIEDSKEYTVTDSWMGWYPKIEWSTGITSKTNILTGFEYSLAPDSKITITDYVEDEMVEGVIMGSAVNNETNEAVTLVSGTFKVYLY